LDLEVRFLGWHLQYEQHIDSHELETMKKAGLNIPEQSTEPVSLTERQEQLRSMVEQYVSDARPDLLPSLQPMIVPSATDRKGGQ
jgi:hypothetical protein